MDVELRRATPDDIRLLRVWQAQPHVAAAGVGAWDWEAQLLPPGLEGHEDLIAEVGGRATGYVQIVDPARSPEGYWGETPPGTRAIDIWIGAPADLGRGLGTRIMTAAIERCFADPTVRAILIDPLTSNTAAHRFYRRLGFRFVEERRFDDDDCSVFELTCAAWRKGDDHA